MKNRSPFTLTVASALLAVASAAAGQTDDGAFYTASDYDRVEKIDLHAHIHTYDSRFVDMAEADRFRFVDIGTHNIDPGEMALRNDTSLVQHALRPDRVVAVVSFPMPGWDEPGWAERTIRLLDERFEAGAAGVKLWKNIGMEFQDRDGNTVMVDNPRFDPIFDHLVERDIPVIAHLGEPRECWLPLDQMVIHKGYFSTHPEYHMYLHPEMPSYEDQLAARDAMLKKHPRMRFAGAHLASLEWSVDELAAFLDRFPDAIVETAARVPDLQYQSSRDREKVRQFFIDYQDRVAYGTDLDVRPDDDPEEAIARARERWHGDWTYFATDGLVKVRQLEEPVRGLQLPREVVEKLYHRNTERFFGEDAWEGGGR